MYVKEPIQPHYHPLFDTAFFIFDMVKELRKEENKEEKGESKIKNHQTMMSRLL